MSPLPKGTFGSVLEVDLALRTALPQSLDERLAELVVGGRGLGTALLVERFLRLCDRHPNPFRAVDPLAAENPLILATSPANGTSVPTSARFHANFKSPLTGGIGSTNSGGRWGVEFKRTGHDAMVVTGRSPHPVVGGNLDIYDLEPITEANYLCNRLDLDTISAGGTIAALMEIFGIAQAKRAEARTEGEEGERFRDRLPAWADARAHVHGETC
jgi:aldehyde:ferredoxin oxidoreductase